MQAWHAYNLYKLKYLKNSLKFQLLRGGKCVFLFFHCFCIFFFSFFFFAIVQEPRRRDSGDGDGSRVVIGKGLFGLKGFGEI